MYATLTYSEKVDLKSAYLTPAAGLFLPQVHNLKKLDRISQGDATY